MGLAPSLFMLFRIHGLWLRVEVHGVLCQDNLISDFWCDLKYFQVTFDLRLISVGERALRLDQLLF